VADLPFEHGDALLPLTISVGIAMFPHQGTTPDELLAAADQAMYGAKLRGGNAVHSDLTSI
jgi:diguanylate cyclase (GGDEF)-like protein